MGTGGMRCSKLRSGGVLALTVLLVGCAGVPGKPGSVGWIPWTLEYRPCTPEVGPARPRILLASNEGTTVSPESSGQVVQGYNVPGRNPDSQAPWEFHGEILVRFAQGQYIWRLEWRTTEPGVVQYRWTRSQQRFESEKAAYEAGQWVELTEQEMRQYGGWVAQAVEGMVTRREQLAALRSAVGVVIDVAGNGAVSFFWGAIFGRMNAGPGVQQPPTQSGGHLEGLMLASNDWAMDAWCPTGETSVKGRLEAAALRMARATKADSIEAILRQVPLALASARGLRHRDILTDEAFLRPRLAMLAPAYFDRVSGARTANVLELLYDWDHQLGVQ